MTFYLLPWVTWNLPLLKGANSFILELIPIEKGGKHKNGIVTSTSENESIHFEN